MKLSDFFQKELEQAIKNFSKKIEKDFVLISNTAETIIGLEINCSLTQLKKIETSITSKETSIPNPRTLKSIDEKGHVPIEFLKTYFRCLLENYIRTIVFDQDQKFTNYLDTELYNLYLTIHFTYDQNFYSNDVRKHEYNLNKFLMALKEGQVFCYCTGFKDHTIYINYFKHNAKLFGVIHNLGYGIDFHSKINNAQNNPLILPHVMEIPIQMLQSHCISVTHYIDYEHQDNHATIEAILSNIYRSGFFVGTYHELAELPQTTGNCVVKGYLNAMKFRCLTLNSIFFKKLIEKNLEVLLSHINHLQKGIHPKHLDNTIKSTNQSLNDYNSDGKSSQMKEVSFFGHPETLPSHSSNVDKIRNLPICGGALVSALTAGVIYNQLEKKDVPNWVKVAMPIGTSIITGLLANEIGSMIVEHGVKNATDKTMTHTKKNSY